MKKFKMPSAFTILFMIIILAALLTWVIPAGTYQYQGDGEPLPGTYSSIARNPQGMWEVLSAPVKGFFEASDIIMFMLVIGGFLGVVNDTGAIDAGIGSIVERFRGREHLMITALMLIFAAGGTIFGMAEETIAFYVLVIPVFIAAGFDAMTGVAVILIGAGIGCIGSTVNPFATGIASGFAGISIGEGITLRIIILALITLVSVIYVSRYALKVKKDPSLSVVAHMREKNEEHFLGSRGEVSDVKVLTGKQKAVLTVFALCFLIMIIGVIPWARKFDIYFFEDMAKTIADIPVLGSLLGKITPLGDWWFPDITVLFLFASIICAFIWKWNESEFIALFLNGAKDLLGVALIIGVTRGIAVVMNDGGMTATILHLGEESLRPLGNVAFSVISYIFFILLSFLIPSSSGLAALAMPVMAPIADFAGVSREIVVTAFATASGLVNLITPTSGILMGALAIGRVSYGAYLKWAWKLILILFVIIMLCIAAGSLL